MKQLLKLIFFSLALSAIAACSKDPKQGPDPVDPKIPRITMLQCPEEWEAGTSVDVIAGVTIEEGSISSVMLYYNDGSEKSAAMSETSNANEYSASFTAPASAGETITYYIKAISAENKTSKSETVTLTTVAESINPAEKLRLSEIGTSGSEFIEIYNPTGMIASLDGVSLRKNGEELIAFTSSKELPAKAYGVFRAKESTIAIPISAVDLGATDAGLSGSKSLSVELRYNGDIIDAFANTINPGVSQMTVGDWDGTPEQEATNFNRPNGVTYGWYATASTATTAATPGKENGTVGMRVKLKHQLFKEDAVACPPYIANIKINPDKPATGLTPEDNIIQFSVYYDAYSAAPSVSSTMGTPSKIEGIVWQIKPTLTGSSTGTENTITLTATNATGPYASKITVLGFSAATTFDTYGKIRINEIRTSTKDGIELYNTSSQPVVIGGMRIRKNKDSLFIIPGYMVMKGYGYAVLGCNGKDYSTTGTAYLNLGTVANGLSGSKSLLIELRKPKIEGDLTNSTNIDSFVNISTSVASPNKDSTWDIDNFVEKAIGDGQSVGRKPDGTGPWYLFTNTTTSMGASNSASINAGTAFTQTYHQDGAGE